MHEQKPADDGFWFLGSIKLGRPPLPLFPYFCRNPNTPFLSYTIQIIIASYTHYLFFEFL